MPSVTDQAIAIIAAECYTARRDEARAAVRERRVNAHHAEEVVRHWLAIACYAGADLPELADRIADRVAKTVDGNWIVSPAQARDLVAAELIEGGKPVLTLSEARTIARTTLAKARDAALNRVPAQCALDDPRFQKAQALNRLANALHCKPYLPPAQQPASERDAA